MIAAVLVNYAGAEDTIACVGSLQAADPRPDVIVIVDNCSPDDSLWRLRDWLAGSAPYRLVADFRSLTEEDRAFVAGGPPGRVVLVGAHDNLGFGRGINIGWSVARLVPGLEHVLVINNDATVEPGFLAPLLTEMADPAVGAAAGTILHTGPSSGIWYAGGEFRWWQCRGAHLIAPAAEPRDVTFCTGCLILVREAAMASVGGIPEVYFLYYEDVEFSLRLAKAGWRLRYAPGSVVRHTVGSSAGHRRERAFTAFVSARNRFWLARRNLPPWQRILATPNILADETGRALGALGRGRPDVAAAIARGVVAGLRGAPLDGEERVWARAPEQGS